MTFERTAKYVKRTSQILLAVALIGSATICVLAVNRGWFAVIVSSGMLAAILMALRQTNRRTLYIMDRGTDSFEANGALICRLGEVAQIQIVAADESRGKRIKLSRKDGRRIAFGVSFRNESEAEPFAAELADFIGIPRNSPEESHWGSVHP